MQYEGENGFKARLGEFIKTGLQDAAQFGVKDATEPVDFNEACAQILKSEALPSLFHHLCKGTASMSAAAAEINLFSKVDGVLVGKGLGALLVAYYLLRKSSEVEPILQRLALESPDVVRSAWKSTNALPLNPSKKSPFHSLVMRILQDAPPLLVTDAHIIELATVFNRATLKTLVKSTHGTFTSLVELDGLVAEHQQCRETAARKRSVSPTHDIAATLPPKLHRASPPPENALETSSPSRHVIVEQKQPTAVPEEKQPTAVPEEKQPTAVPLSPPPADASHQTPAPHPFAELLKMVTSTPTPTPTPLDPLEAFASVYHAAHART